MSGVVALKAACWYGVVVEDDGASLRLSDAEADMDDAGSRNEGSEATAVIREGTMRVKTVMLTQCARLTTRSERAK